MNLSKTARLTFQWQKSFDEDDRDQLIEHLLSVGNTETQVKHWLRYSEAMVASEDEAETIESVVETDAAIARMQGRIR